MAAGAGAAGRALPAAAVLLLVAAMGRTAQAAQLATPTGVAYTKNARGGVDVSWDAVAGAAYYVITPASADGGFVPDPLESYPGALALTVSSLTQGKTYTFGVVAMPSDAVNDTPSNSASAAAVLSRVVPDAPLAVDARSDVALGAGTITVVWFPPYDGGAPIDTYTVTLDHAGGPDTQVVAAGTLSHGFAVAGYDPNDSWTAKVSAHNEAGDGPESGDAEVRPPGAAWPGLVRIKPLALGDRHACAVVGPDATFIRCWGKNGDEQCGVDTSGANIDDPSSVAAIDMQGEVVLQLAAGDEHTCALTDGMRAHCWGKSNNGRLGLPASPNTPSEGEVDFGGDVIDLACGADHTCVILDGGAVRCTGFNGNGRLGTGDTVDVTTDPATNGVVAVPEPCVSIVASAEATAAVTATGKVLSWGKGVSLALGYGGTADQHSPVYVDGATDVVSLALGVEHGCALRSGGSVVCWGNGPYAGTGASQADSTSPKHGGYIVSPSALPFTSLSGWLYHTCALLGGTGKYTCWGEGGSGRMGTGSSTDMYSPAFTGVLAGASDTPVLQVVAGGQFSCVLYDDLGVECVGDNNDGELGVGGTADKFVLDGTRVDLGGDVTIVPSPVVVNVAGCEDYSGSTGTASCPSAGGAVIDIAVSATLPGASVSAIADVSVTVDGDDCTGVSVDAGTGVVSCTLPALASAGPHTLLVTIDGDDAAFLPVSSSGNSDAAAARVGYLTAGDETGAPVVTQVTGCGGSDGADTVGCRTASVTTITVHGYNFGGTGATVDVGGVACTSPAHVTDHETTRLTCALQPGSGDGHEVVVTAPGKGASASGGGGVPTVSFDDHSVLRLPLAVGFQHTCVVDNGGTGTGGRVRCWGKADVGQLGTGTHSRVTGSADATVLDLGADVVQVVAGEQFTLVLLANGRARAWGYNIGDSLGYGVFGSANVYAERVPDLDLGDGDGDGGKVAQVAAGGNTACLLRVNGTVFCYGRGDQYQTGQGSTADITRAIDGEVSYSETFVFLSFGYKAVCGITSSRRVACWGESASYGTALGTTVDARVPTEVPGLTDVAQLSVGASWVCAISGVDLELKCAGAAASMQLGSGSQTTVQTFSDAIAAPFWGTQRPIQVTSSRRALYTCATTDALDSVCFGAGSNTPLFTGSTSAVNSAVDADPIDLGGVPATEFASSYRVTVVVRADLTLVGVGLNTEGQLGYGDTLNSHSTFASGGVLDLNGDTVLAAAPRVLAVSGCDDSDASSGVATTAACPSAGGATLTVQLDRALPVASVAPSTTVRAWVGGQECTGVAYDAATASFTCAAPAHATAGPHTVTVEFGGDEGVFRAVRSVDALSSHATVGYLTAAQEGAALGPVVTRVKGCGGDIGDRTMGCATAVTTHLTITGHNFGTAGTVSVTVGGVACTGAARVAASPTNAVQCDLQPAVFGGVDLPVVVTTDDGTSTANADATVSYDDFTVVRRVADAYDGHTCVIRDDFSLQCWGGTANQAELGVGLQDSFVYAEDTTAVALGEDALSVAVADEFTCVLTASKRVRCFGRPDDGGLGYGVEVKKKYYAVSAGYLDFDGSEVLEVCAGALHACARLANGTVACWGDGASGRLMSGSTTDIWEPREGFVPGWTFSSISCGLDFSCGVLDDGTGRVVCAGGNVYGQLSRGFTGAPEDDSPQPMVGVTDAIGVACGGLVACVSFADGNTRCVGYGGTGALGNGLTLDHDDVRETQPVPVRFGPCGQYAAGEQFAACLARDGTVRTWGSGSSSRTGQGVSYSITAPDDLYVHGIPDDAGNVVNALAVGAGKELSIFVTSLLTFTAAGEGENGQLGYSGVGDATRPLAEHASLGGSGRLAMPQPRVLWVSGCDDDVAASPAGTDACPSAGGATLSVKVDRLLPNVTIAPSAVVAVWVGGVECTDATLDRATSTITCAAPAHATAGPHTVTVEFGGDEGVFRAVRSVDALSSHATVGYLTAAQEGAALGPVVTRVKGCGGDIDTRTIGCVLSSATRLTITGHNFGTAGTVSVTVGGVACTGAARVAASPTNAVQCDLQPAVFGGVDLPVVVTTDDGTSTANADATVSYDDFSVARQPLATYWEHSCVVLQGFDVSCFGEADDGATGLGALANTDVNTATEYPPLDFGADVLAVSVGSRMTCVLLATKRIKCIGDSSAGQLGMGRWFGRSLYAEMAPDLPLPGDVVQLSVVHEHGHALLANGTAYGWGFNQYGVLGGDVGVSDVWTAGDMAGRVKVPDPLSYVTSSRYHGMAITDTPSRQLWTWGRGTSYQLGLGDDVDHHAPEAVPGVTDVLSVAGGEEHTCVVQTVAADAARVWASGGPTRVLCWGISASGRLGRGSAFPLIVPTELPLTGITFPVDPPALSGFPVTVRAGLDATCVITNAQNLYCFGGQSEGKLGLTAGSLAYSPVDNGGVDLGSGGGGRAVYPSVGFASAGVVTNTYTARLYGAGDNGRIGYGDFTDSSDSTRDLPVLGTGRSVPPLPTVVRVSGCDDDVVSGGRGLSTGFCPSSGGSRLSVYLSHTLPAAEVAPNAALAVTVGGESCSDVAVDTATNVVTCTLPPTPGGGGDPGPHTVVVWLTPGPEGVFSAVATASGRVAGALEGQPTVTWMTAAQEAATLPVVTRVSGCPSITADGSSTYDCATLAPAATVLTVRGHNLLGSGAVTVTVGGVACSGAAAVAGAAGNALTCSLPAGTAGASDLPVVVTTTQGESVPVVGTPASVSFADYPARAQIIPLAAGVSHTCVIVGPHMAARCVGLNDKGQLGQRFGVDDSLDDIGAIADLPFDHPVVQVAVGMQHSCFLLSTGQVRCVGARSEGKLGTGADAPVNVDARSAADVRLGGPASKVCAGSSFNCAVLAAAAGDDAGAVRCWGANNLGQIGTGDNVDVWVPEDAGDVPLPSAAIDVACGMWHACALLSDRTVQCWGYNSHGQLGAGSGATSSSSPLGNGWTEVRSVAAGGYMTCVLLRGGDVECVGQRERVGHLPDEHVTSTDDAQPLVLPTASPVVQVSAGETQTCLLFADATLLCFGTNSNRELGTPGSGHMYDTSAAGVEALELPDSGAAFLSAAPSSTCALRRDLRVVCWGSSDDYGESLDGVPGSSTSVDTAVPAPLLSPVAPPSPDVVRVTSECADAGMLDSTQHCPPWGQAQLRVFGVGAFSAAGGGWGGAEAFTVYVGDAECVSASVLSADGVTGDTYVACTLPPDGGNNPPSGAEVRLVTSRDAAAAEPLTSRTSDNDVTVQYSPVTALEPVVSFVSGCASDLFPHARGCATGDVTRLEVHGYNFGDGSPGNVLAVSVGGVACDDVDHDDDAPTALVTCDLPPGLGAGHTVIATSAEGSSSQDVTVNYALPQVVSMYPSTGAAAAGGEPWVIVGNGFAGGGGGAGSGGGSFSVLVGNGIGLGVGCSVTNNTHIACTTPPGFGAANPVTVTVSGQQSEPAVAAQLSYAPPQVFTAEVSSTGGTLRLRGVNFGGVDPFATDGRFVTVTTVDTTGGGAADLACGGPRWLSDVSVECVYSFGGPVGCDTRGVVVVVAGLSSLPPGESSVNATDVCFFEPGVAPPPPTGVSVTMTGQTSLTARWTRPETDATITYFKAEVSTDPDFGTIAAAVVTDDGVAESAQVHGLTFGATYYVRVFSVGPDPEAAQGIESAEARAGASVPLGFVPRTPINVRGKRVVDASADVKIDVLFAVPTVPGNTPLSGVQIEFSRGADFDVGADGYGSRQLTGSTVTQSAITTTADAGDGATQLITYTTQLQGFLPNPYYFRVTVTNAIGSSETSDVSDAVLDACSPAFEYLATDLAFEDWTCATCPRGAYCGGGNHTQITARQGFWRVPWVPGAFAECFQDAACEGVREVALEDGALTTGTEQCAAGYEGALCAACRDDWAPGADYLCTECLSGGLQVVVSLLGIVVAVAVISFLIRRTMLNTGGANPLVSIAKILISHLQVSAMAARFDLTWPGSVDGLFGMFDSVSSVGEDLVAVDCFFASDEAPGGMRRFYKIVVFMLFLPLIFVTGSTLFWLVKTAVDKRKAVSQVVKVTEAHSSASGKGSSGASASSAGAGAAAAASAASPPPAPAATAAASGGTSAAPPRQSPRDDTDNATILASFSLWDRILVSAIVILFMLHPGVSGAVMKLFTCTLVSPAGAGVALAAGSLVPDADGRRFLTADMTQECFTSDTDGYMFGLGLPAMVAVVLGIPLLAFVLLFTQSSHLQSKDTQRKLGFLYGGFRPAYYYWEVLVVTGRKVAFTAVSVIAAPLGIDIQVYSALIVLFAALGLHVAARPFDEPLLNKLELTGIVGAAATLLLGLFIHSPNTTKGGGAEAFFTLCIVAVNVYVILVFAWGMVVVLRDGEAKRLYGKVMRLRAKIASKLPKVGKQRFHGVPPPGSGGANGSGHGVSPDDKPKASTIRRGASRPGNGDVEMTDM